MIDLPKVGSEITVVVKQQNYYMYDTSEPVKYYTYTGTVLKNEPYQLPGTFRMTGDSDRIPVRVVEIDNVVKIGPTEVKVQGIQKAPTSVIHKTIKSSNGIDRYDVTIHPNGLGKCTCKGFTFRGTCRHMNQVLLTLNQK